MSRQKTKLNPDVHLEKLGRTIKQVQWRNHRMLDARLSEIGISLVQWNALREIERNPEASGHALAELTFNSDQAFGTLSTRLIKLGFVTRKSGKGRAIVHNLTGEGKLMLQRGRVIVAELATSMFEPLTKKECLLLLDLMTKLLE